ncbi:MAG: hypothetical protein U0872_02405 [Planctomycetaceae bacterium]
MMTVKCHHCGVESPRRETLTIKDQITCDVCAEQVVEECSETLTQADVVRNIDPTVCSWCSFDGGQTELGTVAALPTCEPCEARMRNWPLPGWIKLAFVTLTILGVLSFLFNVRHVQGAFAARAGKRAFASGNLDLAVEKARLAANKVPEFKQYRLLADLFEGIRLLSQDEPAEALKKLQSIAQEAPNDPMVKDLMTSAEISLAFEQHNYDRFLELAQRQQAAHPQDRRGDFQVASALACKYAETGSAEFRDAAEKRLNDLGADRDPDETDYRQRIQHRLTTRRIISRQQFHDKFPRGWKPEE